MGRRGASATVGQCGVAGSGPAVALVGGTRPMLKQGRRGLSDGPATVPDDCGLNTFQI
jgi:hypothetical protein